VLSLPCKKSTSGYLKYLVKKVPCASLTSENLRFRFLFLTLLCTLFTVKGLFLDMASISVLGTKLMKAFFGSTDKEVVKSEVF